jgi:hypothetical protein
MITRLCQYGKPKLLLRKEVNDAVLTTKRYIHVDFINADSAHSLL